MTNETEKPGAYKLPLTLREFAFYPDELIDATGRSLARVTRREDALDLVRAANAYPVLLEIARAASNMPLSAIEDEYNEKHWSDMTETDSGVERLRAALLRAREGGILEVSDAK